MNFTVKRAELYDALKTALHAVTKSNLQAANGLLISADAHKGTVEITGTDIRTTVIKRIKEAAVTESGEVVAPQVTADIIRLARSEEITLKTDENGVLTLLFGDSKYELPTIPAKEFPKSKITYPTNYVSVNGFGTLLRRCAFAAETRGEMQNIQCVRVKLDSGESRCEATDTKRMAMSVGFGSRQPTNFANSYNVKADIFEKGKYTTDDILSAASHFFGGRTDFEAPLNKAMELIGDGFENADAVSAPLTILFVLRALTAIMTAILKRP